jgi:hypothetical protein
LRAKLALLDSPQRLIKRSFLSILHRLKLNGQFSQHLIQQWLIVYYQGFSSLFYHLL